MSDKEFCAKGADSGREPAVYRVSDGQMLLLSRLLSGSITTKEYVAELMRQQRER